MKNVYNSNLSYKILKLKLTSNFVPKKSTVPPYVIGGVVNLPALCTLVFIYQQNLTSNLT
jgi:hypothetical protein